MYSDLNLFWPTNPIDIQTKTESTLKAAEELVDLGFTTLAFNQTIDVPYPSKLAGDFHALEKFQQRYPQVQCLKRLTMVMDDVSSFHQFLRTHSLTSYDLFAVCPTTEKAWQQCCSEIQCDLISLDYSSKLPFYFKPTMVNEAQRRGVSFEISFAPAFKDDASKRNLISNARNLIRVTQGKHVILSSGAIQWLDTRGVLDIINLGCLFGMNPDRAKHAISLHPRAVLMHAMTRTKTYRAVASVIPVSDLKPEELWKTGVKANDNEFIAFDEEPENAK